MPTRDELLQIANAKASEAAIKGIAADYQANTTLYYEAAAAGKWDDAASYLREARRLENEALPFVQAAQQQQQQQQSQFTQIEQDMLRAYPQIASDPKKWGVALAASRNLQLRGYDRNSPEYAQGVLHACDVLNADLTESREVASPDEALRACQSKYGAVTVDEYNNGVQRLIEEKRSGKYPMSQT
jgi:hypothetical protein